MLVVTWLNSSRHCVIFDSKESLGVDLLLKLGILTGALLQVVLRTTYYVASHTGSLDRVLRQGDSCTVDFSPKYSRRAKVVTVLCWIFVLANVIYYINMAFSYDELKDLSLVFIIQNFRISTPYSDIVKAVFILLELEALATWSFTQAMKFISCSQGC